MLDDLLEYLNSIFEQIKGWFYTFSVIVLTLNLYTDFLYGWAINLATYSMIILFIVNIVYEIIGTIGAIKEGDYVFLSICSLVISLGVSIFMLYVFASPEKTFELLNVSKSAETYSSSLAWPATCIAWGHFITQLVSLPIDLISVFLEGEYD